MKIKDNNTMVEFKDLKPGDVFSCDGKYCMKTRGVYDVHFGLHRNAVVLNDGSMWHIEEDQAVTKVNGHFEIY